MTKQKKRREWRRSLAMLLVFALAFTCVDMSALAANGNDNIATYASSSSYQPLTVSSGYNADIVATSTNSSSSEYYKNTAAMDGSGTIGSTKYACLYSSAVSSSAGYLPSSRTINSTATSGLYWQMASYTSNNALKIYGSGSGTLNFSTVGCYKKIYFLCTAGGISGGSSTMTTTINYSDGSTGSSSFTVYDWYSGTSAATSAYRRIVSGSVDGSTTGGPYFTQCAMTVNTTKLIKSIKVTNTNASATLCVFGVTGEVSDIAAPTVTLSNAGSYGFTANWNAVSGAKEYRLDVAKDASFSQMVTGYNNKNVANTSIAISGLSTSTTYYVRVRAVDAAGAQGSSSSVKSIKTLDPPTGPVTLLNDGYPYGQKMNTSNVTLVTDVQEDDLVGSYQWQYATTKNGEWKNLTNKIYTAETTGTYTFTPTDGYWYRCIVNDTTISKAVQLVKANATVMQNVTRPYSYGQWYVSNESVAYTSTVGSGSGRNFDVLGKYKKDGKIYWLQTSFSSGWQMYTSASPNPTETSYYSGSAMLKCLRVAFSESDDFNMIFDAHLASSERAFAFGCDTMLGNWQTSGSYSDYASLKSIINEQDQTVRQIQMVGAYSVDTAKATDTSFVLKYRNGYLPKYYWLGRYSQRKVWTNAGSIEDVISTDSGMTSSWFDLNPGGHVEFEFHVGAVADTGAKITVSATSTTTGITINDPDSSYEYTLVTEDGTVISDWKQLDGSQYKYDNLDPNTKYIVKARKDGEESKSEIYTAIDTNTGADNAKITWDATTSSLTFSDLKQDYEYALEDVYGNRVMNYTTPQDHKITWNGLRAGTTYYLVARDGDNDLSERVQAKTKNATITFDANTDDQVSGMPEAVTKVYGTPLSLAGKTPTRSGYQFAGWTTAAYKDQKVVLYRPTTSYYGETDATLYAVWYAEGETIPTSETYSVSYDYNVQGLSGTVPATATTQWGVPLLLSETTPTRTGCTFTGWNTKADGTGELYQPGDAYVLNTAVTLYAIWQVNTYQIIVDNNDRYTVTVDHTTVKHGDSATLTFRAKDSFDIDQIQVSANGSVLTGQWNEDHTEYTVTIETVNADQYITVSGAYRTYLSISEDSYDFGSLIENYEEAPEAKEFTVQNDGESSMKIKQIQTAEQSVFEVSDISKTTIDSGDTAAFTVRPKLGLTPGVYKEDITVTTTTGVSETIQVIFTVEKEQDVTAPDGVITVGEHQWTTYQRDASFAIYYKEPMKATIQAEDTQSGVKSIQYYLSSVVMKDTEVEALYNTSPDKWIEFHDQIDLQPDANYMIYVRLEDNDGNVAFISSNGMVFDGTAPKISGVEDQQEVYLENSYPVEVSDAHLYKVYVTNGLSEYTDADEITLTDGSLTLAASEKQKKTIIAIDKAGNRTDVTVSFVSLQEIKKAAQEVVDQKADKAKQEIDQLDDLTAEEKTQAKEEIDQKAQEAKEAIDASKDRDQVSDKQENGQTAIEEKQKDAEKTDLTNAKDKATEEIDQKAEQAKEAIDQLEDLTADEKAAAKEEIDQKAEEAKKQVEKVTDPSQKSEVKNSSATAQEGIEEKQKEAESTDLTNAKDKAADQIKKQTEEAKEAIDKLPNLSDSEKEAAKEELDKKAKEAQDVIADATQKTDVTQTDVDVRKDIAQKVSDAKADDYNALKETTSSKASVDVIPTTDGEAKDNLTVSIRVGDTVVEKKENVTSGEKISFKDVPDGVYNLVVSDGTNESTTLVVVKDGKASVAGNVTVGPKSTSVDVKWNGPDIAVAGLEKVYDTKAFTDHKDAVDAVQNGGTTKLSILVELLKEADQKIESALTADQKAIRYIDITAQLKVTDAQGVSKDYTLSDTEELVKLAIPLAQEEKNQTGYAMYRLHNDGEQELVETLPELKNSQKETPSSEGFYIDGDYVIVWAHKFSTYALAYDKVKAVQPTVRPTAKPVPTANQKPANTTTAKPKSKKDQSKLSGNDIDKLKLPLLLARGVGGNKKISLSWTKQSTATGYECYWSYCDGKKNFRKFKTVKTGKAKAVHKKLKNNRKYKYFVVAYKMVNGDKIYIAKSPQLHVAMKADKKTNAKKLIVNAKKVNLNIGKTFVIHSAIKLENTKKKPVLHTKEFRYYSSNVKVAKVSAKGKIKAIGNGKCTIYVIANNGLCKKIKVTVAKNVKATGSKSLVIVGTTFTDKKTKATYRITSLKKKTVEYVCTTDKQAQEIVVASKVKYKGKTYAVTKVADKAFAGNKKLTRIDLAKSVNKIGKQAFQNCSNLKKVVVYSDRWNEKTIGVKAFQNIAGKAHVYCEESVWEKYEGYFAAAGAPGDTIINFLSIL